MTKKIAKSMTGPQATALAAVCSLTSAVLVAWITGAFGNRQAEISEAAKSEGSIQIERFKLQRDLILDAIGTTDREEARRRLQFFAETGLIPDYAEKVLAFTDEKPLGDIPVKTESPPEQLPPWRGQHPSLARAVVLVRSSGEPVCSGLVVEPKAVLTMAHCVVASLPSEISVTGEIEEAKKTVRVVSTEVLSSQGPHQHSQDLVRLQISDELDSFVEFGVRAPVVGEQVFVLGTAPSSAVGYRGATPLADYQRFFVSCSIQEISEEEHFVRTNCRTSAGTSGSPIVAVSDLKVLSLVAWGRTMSETNGPVLSAVPSLLIEGR